ncbi:GntR family transcriptional regulator [Zhihengliuella flava]|uniref:DNA-binding transcriptional regulator YhcF (GntR family) n=1 Tax=Zhihengliuella flava TaxID=1285193 RepID=A0A931D9I4_9MICC|nr:DNA-binding transcriptional regulator YhcF (GntR family) [Zhihengliuella flava]
MAESAPLFLQLAEQIESGVLEGTYAEESQVPSTNEFAAYLRINPATANKGINLLVDKGILYKKRGIGMFVAEGARGQLLAERRQNFAEEYIQPLLRAAGYLELSSEELISMITDGRNQPASGGEGAANARAAAHHTATRGKS